MPLRGVTKGVQGSVFGMALRVARARAWSRVCAVAIVLFGAVAPVRSEAAEAGAIDVPMRRGQATQATSSLAVPDSA